MRPPWLLFTATALLAPLGTVPGAFADDAGRRPNLLVIMTDQQSGDAMSCRIGDRYLQTPAMDSLAARGTVFTRAYCANPLCVPSRTSMFSGRYPHETGFQTNGSRRIDAEQFPCLGMVFRRAGYDTGYVGKWHLPYPQKDHSVHGFRFTTNLRGNGGDAARPAAAVGFLKAPREEPFLLIVSFINPHNICEWARGQDLPDGAIGQPPPLDSLPPLRTNHDPPENETDIISIMRESYQSSRTFPVSGFDEHKWRQYQWAYYRMIEKVDGQIGEVLAALRESGRQENTLVVFTSDHGDCQGAHRWNQKTVFYDESSRVPLIIAGLAAAKNSSTDCLVHTGIDLLPTLCDFADIPIPTGLPGTSLRPAAEGRDITPRDYVVISNKMVQGAPVDGRTPMPEGRMLRSQRYKYCAYSIGSRRESLVDMQQDPGEMANLAEQPQYREILVQHRQMLLDWCREHADDFEQFVPVEP